MGKRGPKPRVKEEKAVETLSEPSAVAVVADVAPEVKEPSPIVEAPKAKQVACDPLSESRKALLHPLDESQEFFESPEGYIVIGEKGRGRAWCRQANGGKGMWINPRR